MYVYYVYIIFIMLINNIIFIYTCRFISLTLLNTKNILTRYGVDICMIYVHTYIYLPKLSNNSQILPKITNKNPWHISPARSPNKKKK